MKNIRILTPMFVAATIVWLSFGSGSARAQTLTQDLLTCGAHTEIENHSRTNYAEFPTSNDLASTGHILEVYVSKQTGSWTIVVTRPDGPSCPVAVGKSWESIRQIVRGPGA